MANKTMKTLTIGENIYEVVDEAARNGVSNLNTLVGNTSVKSQIDSAIEHKADDEHTHTANEVGADPSGSAANALSSAKSYTDTKISDLINSAPTTLDTLGEIATAMKENDNVVSALDTAVGTKANASDLTSHTENKSNPHGVTAAQISAVPTSRTVNGKALSSNITLSASDVGADASGSANTALTNANSYTDTAIANKVDKVSGKGLSTNDYTTTEKDKLAGIADGANKTVVDSALSSTSTNPVQNNVVNTAIADAKTYTDTALTEAKAYTDSAVGSIPNYVVTEAEEVIARVMEAQTSSRVFTMAVLADMHYGSGEYPDGVDHAAQAIKYIADRIKIDALNVHGDFTDVYLDSDYDNGIADVHAVQALLSDVDADKLILGGNHDYHVVGSPRVARAMYGKSDNVVWGSRTGGYYYRDFEDYKLRIVVLNTSETGGGHTNITCSTEQYAWFVSTLDMSAKSDAAEWQILILSHHPLDWSISDDGVYRFANILDAYTNGTSWSGGDVSCDFTDKNAARIICNVHSHLHNLKVDKICLGELGMTSETTDVYRMCMPESCYDRPQSYGGLWNTETTYTKTANTADDTAFTIMCIDLENFTIKAINYGAGIDRTLLYYDPSADTATNMIPLSVASDGTPFNGGLGWISGYRIKSDGSQVSNADYCVTGFIPVANWDYLYLKNMNLVIDSLDNQPNTRAVLYKSDFSLCQITTTNEILAKAHWGGTDGYILNEAGGAAAMGDTIGRLRIVNADAAYIRFSTKKIDATSVVTINEEIV